MGSVKDFTCRPDPRLAAVCGLFCPACSLFIATMEDPARLERIAAAFGVSPEEAACRGCHSEKRGPYCQTCKMVVCAAEKGLQFCGECDDYPCTELEAFKQAMPHRIELWEAQARIREVGFERWFEEMVDHYACPACGVTNSAYDLKCRACGHQPGCQYVSRHREEILAQLEEMRRRDAGEG